MREQSLATYLRQRIDNNEAYGQAATLLVSELIQYCNHLTPSLQTLLSHNDTEVKRQAATALVGLGYASAQWLADLDLVLTCNWL